MHAYVHACPQYDNAHAPFKENTCNEEFRSKLHTQSPTTNRLTRTGF